MDSGAPRIQTLRALIRTILDQDDFDGREKLIAQVGATEYVGGPVTMNQLRVDRSLPPAIGIPSPLRNHPAVVSSDGETIGILHLWLTSDGYIDCLEYGWVTDEMPTRLPHPSQLQKWVS